MSGAHTTVLLQEAVQQLLVDRAGRYVDGTFGRGGHSRLILSRLADDAGLLAIDKDDQAIAHAQQHFADDSRFRIAKGSFAELQARVNELGWSGKVDGILLDLGISSPQVDQAERGFSFLQDGPLDMRMDASRGQTAAEWLEQTDEQEMARIFKEYGEERFARRIARAIVSKRSEQPFTTTLQLASVVAEAHPAWEKGKNPATRVFQAIRIHINNELGDLDAVLEQALNVLAVGGRLVVISFHSLEDHRVKRFIRKQERGDHFPAGLPVTEDQLKKRMKKLGKAIKPGKAELEANPRARSAIMRVAEKLA